MAITLIQPFNLDPTGNYTLGNVAAAGIVSATGNITGNYILGNGAFLTGTSGSYSNATVADYLASGNNTSNIITTGNITSGNLTTSGMISATGTISTFGEVIAQGNITGGYIFGNGSQLTGLPAGYANADVAAYLASGTDSSNIITTANVSGGNLVTGGLISATGNITGGNILGGANVNATTHTGTTVSVSANVTGGNLITSGAISASGAGYIGGGLSVVGNITATGNLNYQNVNDLVVGDPLIYIGANNTADLVDLGIVASANVAGLYQHLGIVRNHSTATWNFFANVVAEPTTEIDWANAVPAPMSAGNITGSNISTAGLITAAGNVTGNYFIGNGSQLTGVIATGVGTLASLSVTGNTTTGNLLTGGVVSAAGNVTGGNIYTGGEISAVGNITANLFLGNGSQLIGMYGDSNVSQYLSSGLNTNGFITSGNIVSNGFSTTGNVTAGYFIGNGSQLTGLPASYSNSNVANYLASGTDTSNIITTANVSGGNILTSGLISAAGNITGGNLSVTNIAGTLTTASQTNITSVGTLGSLSVTANVTGGNILTGGVISAAGNITGGNILGGANVNATTHTGTTVSVTANVTGGNLLTAGLISATGNITGGNILGGANVNATTHTGTTVSVTANVTGGNLLTVGLVSATGTITSAANITGGNILTGGLISSAGNIITAANFVGNSFVAGTGGGGTIAGANLISANIFSAAGNITGGNILTSGVVSATGNITSAADITGGNILTGGLISATGNITGGNILGGANVNATTHTGTTVSVTANVTGGNILTGGVISATGNVTGGNLITPGLITAAGNVTTSGSVFATGIVSAVGNLISNTELYVGNGAQGTGLTNPVIVARATGTTYVQVAAQNTANTGSADLIAYGDNGTDADGWTDIGMAGSGFNDTAYTITYANDGYLFVQGNASGSGGNLVLATGANGGKDIVFATGGFLTANEKMRFINATGQFYIQTTTTANSSTTGALRVGGGAGIAGDVYSGGLISALGNIVTVANVTGGNLLTSGLISAAGNVIGNYIIGNGSQLTGLPASYSDSNVATYLASGNNSSNIITTANVTGGNLTTSGLISTTGNINGGNVNTGTVRNSSGTLTISTGSGNINLTPAGNIVLSANTYINNVGYPAQDADAATKLYVDNLVSTAISYHQSVLAATTANLATTTGGTITYNQPNGAGNGIGATLTTTGSFNLIDTANVQTVGTRILVKNEGNSVYNGVYTWSNATVITRSTDTDEYGAGSPNALGLNDYFFVSSGNVNAGSAWIVDAPSGTITFGTSNISFAQFSQSQVYSANDSAGLSLAGTVFSTKVDNSTTAFDGSGNIIVKASANLTTPNVGAATGTSLSVTGNVTGGNIDTGGMITATGNIGSAGNISATYFIGNGALLTGISAGSTYSNANVDAYLPIYTGNIAANNVSITTSLDGNIASLSGNVTGGNILTGGLISATGNVVSAANVSGGNVLSSALIQGVTISSSGNVVGGNLLTGGVISATGNVTASNLSLSYGAISTAGMVYDPASYLLTIGGPGPSNVRIDGFGGVYAGTGRVVSAAGNVTGGNINTGGAVSATGNVTAANLSLSYGAISTSGMVYDPASVLLTIGGPGPANVRIDGLGGVYAGTGRQISAVGNVTGGNINTGGLVSAASTITSAANITGGNILTGGLISAAGDITGSSITSNTMINPTIGYQQLVAGGALSFANSGISVDFAGGMTATANITGGNILTGGLVSAAGNVAGAYFIGNGALLTGISSGSSTKISNGTSEANIGTSGGNANITIGGTSNVVVVADTGVYVTGITSASGNIVTAGNIVTGGGTGGNITGANVISATTLSATANVTGGNVLTGGLISATSTITSAANITGGNILTTGVVSAAGNIQLSNGWVINTSATKLTIYFGATAVFSIDSTGNVIADADVTAYGNP